MRFTFVLIAVACFAFCGARHVSEGELEHVLRNAGADMSRINTWKCIVYEESKYETSAHNTQSGDHGIFQISQLYWCSLSNQPGE